MVKFSGSLMAWQCCVVNGQVLWVVDGVVLLCCGQDEPAFDHVFAEANFRTFFFRLRAKMETFNVSKVSSAVCFI